MEKNKKRVLFIHIQFYEYIHKIKDEINDSGYAIDSFCEDPNMGILDRILLKCNPKYITIKSGKMQKKLINTLTKTGIKYDYIFVIKGEKISREFLMELKKLNPKAKFILYMWDDVARVSNFFQNKSMYDVIYSFDDKDAEKYKLEFLPLFFCDEFKNTNINEKDIDVYFSGWEHSSRRQILEKIIPILKENKMNYYFHLYTGFLKVLKQKIMVLDFKKEPEYIKYNTLSLNENAELTLSSKLIIDIHHITQNGLTMRTIESLAANCKLITTNNSVIKYDFYNPNNILIINREDIMIDSNFLKGSYQNVPIEIVKKYSLTNWINIILPK